MPTTDIGSIVALLLVLLGTGGPLAWWVSSRLAARKQRFDEEKAAWERKQAEEKARLDTERYTLDRAKADLDADASLVANSESFRKLIAGLQRDVVAAGEEAMRATRAAQAAQAASERSEIEAAKASRESNRSRQMTVLLQGQISEITSRVEAAFVSISNVVNASAVMIGALEDGDGTISLLRTARELLQEAMSLPPIVLDGETSEGVKRKPQTAPLVAPDEQARIRGPSDGKGRGK